MSSKIILYAFHYGGMPIAILKWTLSLFCQFLIFTRGDAQQKPSRKNILLISHELYN